MRSTVKWLSSAAMVVLSGCGMPDVGVQTAALHANPNPELFRKEARPFGRSMERWTEKEWQWVFSVPAAHNPMLDLTGADCAQNQHGPVWYLPSVIDPGGVGVNSRSCTVPRNKALALNLSGILNDFPCPDPNFKPAPGQSLFDFLFEGAQPSVDAVNLLEVSIDGHSLQGMLDYRFSSDDLFFITGDPSLTALLDGCIIGSPQPAVAAGFTIMFKPLSPGQHTIVEHATDIHGTDVTLIYNLTISGDGDDDE